MRRRKSPLEPNRQITREDMFISPDTKSVRRGRRIAPRTEVCRPCLVSSVETPDAFKEGVVLDLNPYGVRVRMLERLEEGAEVLFRLMRDEEFTVPLSGPIRAWVVRSHRTDEGFYDHGLKVRITKITKPAIFRQVEIERPHPRRRVLSRMYSMDHEEEENRSGRSSWRKRG